jgi:hypothetical protein
MTKATIHTYIANVQQQTGAVRPLYTNSMPSIIINSKAKYRAVGLAIVLRAFNVTSVNIATFLRSKKSFVFPHESNTRIA